MKTKLFAVLVLVLTVMTSDLFAGKIIIRGGTINHTYYEVICKPGLISCIGSGNNICPVNYSILWVKDDKLPVSDLVNFVSQKVENGELAGKEMYLDKTVVSWLVDKEENLEIETTDGEFIMDESLKAMNSNDQKK